MNDRIETAQLFLRLARTDRGAIDLLAGGGPEFDSTALFHAQQAAEKTLKAAQALHAPPVRKSHDLALLWHSLNDAGHPPPIALPELIALNPFAVTVRYDDTVLPNLSIDVARLMIDQLLAWVEAGIAGGGT